MNKRWFIALIICCLFLTSCSTKTYEQGYKDGFNDGFERGAASSGNSSDISLGNTHSQALPLQIIQNDKYELSLIDAYKSEEEYTDSWTEKTYSESCYIFKFEFYNKHQNSNIRVALVDASINGHSLRGTSDFHSDDSFSIYTWSGESSDNTAVDCFKLYFSDIESATDIRDAEKMGNADLSFTFRVYIIDEMDDYGEDLYYTIDNAFLYCQ